ncbi:hypothetical protein [Saccharothrix algeriensis]|uniref:Uncharacterized protein n=1 Tax=Saccharothrix algeriensis TaxID=173560 RepID=A0A8T8HWT4_9PSEU|nr:hypothetical protein [Saccharothrix algeriensis]MBM7814667.1 hypothetical protein [Saccharothrix algeriensis]QTR02956.1 hypothetical protein J7S33_28810 [Saccharothrix algeriensis]
MISISLVGCHAGSPADDVPPPAELGERMRAHAAALREDAPYRPPDAEQRRAFPAALAGLGATPSRADDRLRELGFTVSRAVDGRTGRPYALAATEPGAERAWGLYVVDLSQPSRVAVQVPHPANDLRTADIGLALFRRLPGAVLAVAGTHRRAAAGAGDMAHRTDSMFHALAEAHSRERLPQVQVHGFDDDSLPSADLVLSPGAGDGGPLLDRVADDLDGSMRVCRAWARDCGDLEGRRNRQGGVAAEHGAFFAHVEINRTTRESPERWDEVVRALGEALTGT